MKKQVLEEYMKIVLNEARVSLQEGEMPIACMIVKDNKILALEHNKVEACNDATMHAEMLAIKSASKKLNNWRLDGASLIVNVEPCTMCMGAIENARISEVIYGVDETRTGACISRYNLTLFNPKKIKVIKGILEEEAKNILKETFSKS